MHSTVLVPKVASCELQQRRIFTREARRIPRTRQKLGKRGLILRLSLCLLIFCKGQHRSALGRAEACNCPCNVCLLLSAFQITLSAQIPTGRSARTHPHLHQFSLNCGCPHPTTQSATGFTPPPACAGVASQARHSHARRHSTPLPRRDCYASHMQLQRQLLVRLEQRQTAFVVAATGA